MRNNLQQGCLPNVCFIVVKGNKVKLSRKKINRYSVLLCFNRNKNVIYLLSIVSNVTPEIRSFPTLQVFQFRTKSISIFQYDNELLARIVYFTFSIKENLVSTRIQSFTLHLNNKSL